MSRIHIMDVDTTYSTSNVAVGGSGGYEIFLGAARKGSKPTLGRTVYLLKFFYGNANAISGIEIRLTDGIKCIVGRVSSAGNCSEIIFADGEKITSLKVWSFNRGGDGRLGRIELTTDRNGQLHVDAPREGEPHEYDVGSGTLIGIFGKGAGDIHCLGFSLLRPKVLQDYK